MHACYDRELSAFGDEYRKTAVDGIFECILHTAVMARGIEVEGVHDVVI